MKAMLLAAGLGTRLGDLTASMPKVLVEIDGRSLLRIAVEKCTASGFDDIIINVHHFADMVEEEAGRLAKEGFRISISDERGLLLETGGGLYKARNFFNKEPFLLYNTDTITDLDLNSLYNNHLKNKGLATLATRHRPGSRYFLIDKNGILKGWCNKSTGERIVACDESEMLSEIAFSGMHIIDPEIFNHMTEGRYTMTALYLHLASSHNIHTNLDDSGYWFNVGTPENLEAVRTHFSTINPSI